MSSTGLGWIVLGGLFVLGLCVIMFERKYRRRSIGNREVLTMEEIYRNYYGSSGLSEVEVARVWSEIANILHVEAGRLRPTDSIQSLAGAMRSGQTDADDLEEYLIRSPRSAKQKDANIVTLGDAVEYVLSAQREK